MCLIGLVDARLCCRMEVHAHRSFVIGMDRHALQTQFPPSRIELRNGPQVRLPSFHRVSITAAAANPSATPINGLITANQKEMFQPEFSGVGFLFMPLSQAFEDRHFSKFEISSANALGALQNCCAIDTSQGLAHPFPIYEMGWVLVRSRRSGALSQRFETRIVPERIEHRIEPEQRRSERARRESALVRYRK